MKIEASEFFTGNSYLIRNKINLKCNDCLYYPCVTGYQEILDGYDNKISLGDMYMINYTVKGSAKLIYSDRTFDLKKGDLTIVHTFSSRHLIKTGVEPWIIYFAHYTSIASNYLFKHINSVGGLIIHDYPIELIEPYMKKMHKLYNEPQTKEIIFKISVLNYEMILNIVNYVEKSIDLNAEPLDLVDEIKRYMKHNFQDIKSLKEVSSKVPCSQAHFERLFKLRLGLTPNEYLNKLKLQRAIDLLNTTDLLIKEIADKCGFKDVRSFMYLFKNMYHITPSQYRKKNPIK